MTRRVRVRGTYRRPLNEDQIALAFLMLAKQVREEATATEAKSDESPAKRRVA